MNSILNDSEFFLLKQRQVGPVAVTREQRLRQPRYLTKA